MEPKSPTTSPGSTGHPDPEHEACWQLLPWLTTDRLQGDELVRVLDHLKTCPLCRQELAFLPELRFAVEGASFEESNPPRSEIGHRDVMDRIEAYEQQQVATTWQASQELVGASHPAPPRNLAGRWQDALRRAFTPHGWGPRLVWIQSLIIVLLAIPWATSLMSSIPSVPSVDGTSTGDSAAVFRTLTSDPATTDTPRSGQITTEGDLLRLVFDPQTSEEQLRQLMLEVDADLVAGPSPRGVYTARTAPGQGSQAITILRRSPRVDFAESVVDSP